LTLADISSEKQSVSGRWWALTRAQIRPVSVSWSDEFMTGLWNIFKIAEWGVRGQETLIAFKQKLPAINLPFSKLSRI